MITYEVALETAKKLKGDIDNCTETENGYIFGCKNDDNYEGGAGHTPVVILKKDGRAVNMPWFVIHGMGAEIRTFDIE